LFLCRCKRCIINIRYYSYLEQCFITFFQVLVQSYICSLYYLFILLKYVLLVLFFFIISATSITHIKITITCITYLSLNIIFTWTNLIINRLDQLEFRLYVQGWPHYCVVMKCIFYQVNHSYTINVVKKKKSIYISYSFTLLLSKSLLEWTL